MIRLLALLLFAPGGGAQLEPPRIGCWNEPAASGGEARVLYGMAGNLVVRAAGDEGCENQETFGEPDDAGVRTLRIARQWRLAETGEGERYLLYRSGERYELPQ
jgi:hypothetical protein